MHEMRSARGRGHVILRELWLSDSAARFSALRTGAAARNAARPRAAALIAGIVTGVVILLAALGVGLYFGLRGDDTGKPGGSMASSSTVHTASSASDDTEATTVAVALLQEGEILLEAAGDAGPESFTGETFVPEGPPPSLNLPAITLSPTITVPTGVTTTVPAGVTTTVPGAVQVAAVSGRQTGSLRRV